MVKKLVVDEEMSAQEAWELILCFILWGEHHYDEFRNLTAAEVEARLRRTGYDLDGQIRELMNNPSSPVAGFENILVGGEWDVTVSGCKATVSDLLDGVELSKQDIDDHRILRNAYTSDFLAACVARDHAIRYRSIDSLYTAVAKGFSSMEAYFSDRLVVHNAKCGDPSLRLDEKRLGGRGFYSLDEKLKTWLSKMTGWEINLTTSPAWEDYQFLRRLRNDVAIHPKPGAGLTSVDELADAINRFRYGIGSLMYLLHQVFGQSIQSTIIRAMKYPAVRAVEIE